MSISYIFQDPNKNGSLNSGLLIIMVNFFERSILEGIRKSNFFCISLFFFLSSALWEVTVSNWEEQSLW